MKNFSSVGDHTVIATAATLPTGMPANTYIGFNVTIGAHCTLYSCHIDDDVFIGDRCVILEGARIEKGAMLAPGTVVPPGRLIPAKQLWAGNPCEFVKELNVGETWANYTYSYVNSALGDAHRAEFTAWPSNYLLKGSSFEDIEPNQNDLGPSYIDKDIFIGVAKLYA